MSDFTDEDVTAAVGVAMDKFGWFFYPQEMREFLAAVAEPIYNRGGQKGMEEGYEIGRKVGRAEALREAADVCAAQADIYDGTEVGVEWMRRSNWLRARAGAEEGK
jgi:hypothetical protein